MQRTDSPSVANSVVNVAANRTKYFWLEWATDAVDLMSCHSERSHLAKVSEIAMIVVYLYVVCGHANTYSAVDGKSDGSSTGAGGLHLYSR